jgi:septum site-determining protein MinD
MAGTVITLTSGKGGVGKTTTTANTALALAKAKQRVVAIDADIGLRNLDIIMGLESRVVFNLVDVVEGRCELHQALIRDKRVDELYLLPTSQTRDKSAVTPDQMMTLCEELRQIADYILIDSPAGIEHGFQNAVAPADRVAIVTTPDVSALRDADKVIYLLERDMNLQPSLILNRYDYRLVARGDMMGIDDVLDILSIDLLGVVPDDDGIVISTNKGVPAVLNSKVHAAEAYRNIAQRILGDNVPLMRFRRRGLWAHLGRLFGRSM